MYLELEKVTHEQREVRMFRNPAVKRTSLELLDTEYEGITAVQNVLNVPHREGIIP
jgi:hypothetical protein